MELEFKFQNGSSGDLILSISGSVTVKDSGEFKKSLLKCLEEKNLREISLTEVESLDITALQLIYLLKEEYKAAQKSLLITAPKSDEITDIIRRAGLLTVFESQN